MNTHAAFDALLSLEALLRHMQVTRDLRVGEDPRRAARRAGPEVSFGLPHRGERRRWSR